MLQFSKVTLVLYRKRQKAATKYRIQPKTIDYVRTLIEYDWSPGQVSSVLKMCGIPVSYEWIHQYIHDGKRPKVTFYCDLRQGHKRYRKGK